MYANIIVDISYEKLDRIFQYKIPEELLEKIYVGVSVTIPFGKGNRLINGFVIDITDICDYDETKLKSIIKVNEKNIPVEGTLINLAWFIKNTYGSTMNQALKTVIPIKKVTKDVVKRTIYLVATREKLNQYIEEFTRKNAVARLRLIKAFVDSDSEYLDYTLVTEKLNIQRQTVKALEQLGLIEIREEKVYRNPINIKNNVDYNISLNEEQKKVAYDIINSPKNVHLIHGVTGSGKTEVYMEIIDRYIKMGRQVIVLIPEIALTYQTVIRFYARFKDRVSIINSKLSQGERYDQFERAKKGEIDIMIGPRSAIFTPFKNLGLIVIDEEHESSYKSEGIPKYHAREVAVYLANMCGAKVVLGSATPSIESFYACKSGEYELHLLKNRAVAKNMAQVDIVDLREELKNGNRSMFSCKLQELIDDRLRKKEQIMLFINRRGYAGFVSCRSCGKAIRCPHCDVGLNLHNNGKLVCHYCGYETPMVKTCPSCNSKYIAAFGTGTQKVEEAVKKMYPTARVLRMDMDTTSKKDGHERILSAFANEEADILIGTQMIVKGHDFPNVTLVGVIAADLSLYAADYRANERTFDLLTQAAGRAGRSRKNGNVIIQTYNPEEYSITLAAKQCYEEFYDQEILYRTLNGYPPVINMLAILITSESYENADKFSKEILEIINKSQNKVMIIGPADCNIKKISDIYRKIIYLKDSDINKLVHIKNKIEEYKEINDVASFASIQFDMNPLSMY